MKTLFLFLVGLTAFASAPVTDGSYDLTVELAGLKSTDGVVRICLMNTEEQFLKDCHRGKIFSFRQDEPLQVQFADLSPGSYAIMAYHDENADNALDCNGLFGLPSEPYAFSNNPSTLFGPPAYRKCVFTVAEDRTIKLKF